MYLEILNKKEVEETDDLGKDLMIVSNYLLPFLNESDSNLIKNSLINFITSEKEKIKTYLTDKYRDNELVNKPNYNNIEELKIKIRFYLQEVLKEINKKVEEKDLILEIKENIQNIINYKLTEGKSRVFSLYIDIIETIVTELRNLINGIDEITKKEEFINNLNNILNEDISENNNMYDIMNQTRNMIILLYQLQIDINDYINFQNNLNAMTFTLIK